jgi:4-amino-4-deoxy-L-arabinose transferase-like glycosyltransferase
MDIKNYVENHYYLLLTALFVSVIVSVKLYVQLSVGPGWDTYSFSLNALEYAGIGTGYYELDRGLFVPFLASLLFRTGIVSIYVMMFLDSLFALLGGIFLYLLITLKTEKIVGMLSSLIYITSFIMLEWIGVGYTDIASVTLSIMALYFWVRGNDERPILIPLSWILLMLAFLTRTTAALIIVPMVFYYVSTQKRITFVWQHLVGIAGALGVSLPSLIFYANRTGNPLFYFNMVLSGFGRSTESTGATGEIYSQSKYFFIDNIGKALLVDKIQFLAFFFVVVSSCTVILLYIFRSRKRVMSFWLFIAFSIFILVLFEYSSFMVVEMASFLSLYALYR